LYKVASDPSGFLPSKALIKSGFLCTFVINQGIGAAVR